MLPRTRSTAVSKRQLHKYQVMEGGFILIIPKSCLDKRGHYKIRDLLANLNDKIDSLTGYGTYCISDIVNEINSIKGSTDLTDIFNALNALNNIDGLYNLDDIHNKLESIETTIILKD